MRRQHAFVCKIIGDLRFLKTLFTHVFSCLGPEENSERKAKTIGWEKMSSQQVVMRILEDITTDMAVSIPLALIGNWILQEFSSAQFAYFRSSLLGLLAAHSYEHNILQVIHHGQT